MELIWIFVSLIAIAFFSFIFLGGGERNNRANNNRGGGGGGGSNQRGSNSGDNQRGKNLVVRKVLLNLETVFSPPSSSTTTSSSSSFQSLPAARSDAAKHLLLALAAASDKFDLMVLAKVVSDEQEKAYMTVLDDLGLFNNSLFDKNKCLFCETSKGKESIARQIEPYFFFETDLQVVQSLSKFVQRPVWIQMTADSTTTTTTSLPQLSDNVTISKSLEDYFAKNKML